MTYPSNFGGGGGLEDKIVGKIPEEINGYCPTHRCDYKGSFKLVKNDETGDIITDTIKSPLYKCPKCGSSHESDSIFEYSERVEERIANIYNL